MKLASNVNCSYEIPDPDNLELDLASNDWTEVRAMHARMAVMRAVEQGFAMVRPTKDGFSLVTDAFGSTIARQDTDAPGEHVLVTAENGRLFSFDARSGIEQWSIEVGDVGNYMASTPAVTGATIVLGSNDGSIVGVSTNR